MARLEIPPHPVDQFQALLMLFVGLYKLQGLDVGLFARWDGAWVVEIKPLEGVADAPAE